MYSYCFYRYIKFIKEAISCHVRCNILPINYSCLGLSLKNASVNVLLQIHEKKRWGGVCMVCRHVVCFSLDAAGAWKKFNIWILHALCMLLVRFLFGFVLKNKVLNSPVLSPWCFTSHTGDRNSSQPARWSLLKSNVVLEGKETLKTPQHVS